MVSWTTEGTLSGYSAYEKGLSNTLYKLATSGTVDLNGITRLQYAVDQAIYPNEPYPNRLNAKARITFTSADVAANPGRLFSLAMFIAAADQFAEGVVPTPAQIMAAPDGAQVYRSTTVLGSLATPAAGTMDFIIPGPLSTDLLPNKKYWVLVIPAASVQGSTPSTLNDRALLNTTANASGRALSIWTNRPPNKPVITSPPTGSSIPPGTTFELAYDPKDPDKVSPDLYNRDNQDLAGVQFQYSPAPTEASPDPPWSEMVYYDAYVDPWPAAFILGQNDWIQPQAREKIVENLKVPVVSGDAPAEGLTIPLPTGAWRIRVRTFDFGHPYPSGPPPLGDTTGSYRANTYPALNTSPWSDPILVTVLEQATPPVPLRPMLDVAVSEAGVAALTWQYRNAYSPPFPQKGREVQIRKVGDATWTTLVSGNGTAPSINVTAQQPTPAGMVAYPFTPGRYEWRVRTTDTADKTSDWSTPARFWIVAAPGSGEVVPIPSGSIEGASLGCGTHTVEIFRRGGKIRVGELRGITYLDYDRVRDDISTSKIVIRDWDIDCGNLLSVLQTWAYEVVITRNNGFTKQRVWEGPISLLTYKKHEVVIQAKDVMNFAYRRIIKQAMVDTGSGSTVVDRATRVLQNVFGPDDPNVLAYLTVIARDDDPMQYRSTPEYSRTAFEEVDDMASNSGLDYTVVGRRIILWGTKNRIGTLPEFKDDDLGDAPIVSEYGMSMANRYAVSDGNGLWGEATRLDEDGNDPEYGLVEMLSSSWASDSTEDSGTYTEAGRDKVKKSFEESSERSIDDRYRPGAPVVVRVPDNTTLNPKTVISFQQLVPGVVVPLVSNGTLRKVKANQKLDSVKVTEEEGQETITITLSPFGGVTIEEVVE